MTKFARVPLSLASNKGLGSDAQVYIVLMSYADRTGHAWPKVETLARQTGLHERTVQRSLRRLVDARLIKMELPKPGHPSSNVYSIVDHPGVTDLPPQGGEVDTSGVTTAVTPGVTQRATHNRPLKRPLNKDARAHDGAPDGRRRSVAPIQGDDELLARLHLKGFVEHGVWLPEWGEPPSLEAAA